MEKLITKNLTKLFILSHSCLAEQLGVESMSSDHSVESTTEKTSFPMCFPVCQCCPPTHVKQNVCWMMSELLKTYHLVFFSYRNLLIIVPHTAQLLNMFFFLRQKYSFASNPQVSEVTDDNIMRHLLICAVFYCSQNISTGWPILMYNKCKYNSCMFQLNYKWTVNNFT